MTNTVVSAAILVTSIVVLLLMFPRVHAKPAYIPVNSASTTLRAYIPVMLILGIFVAAWFFTRV